MKIINKVYNINSYLNKNIVLISDIHYSNKKDIKRLNHVLNNIKNIKPDFICIPGDLIDKSQIEDEEDFIKWLKKLSSISKIIISIGNHEFYINKKRKIYGLNKSFFNKISNINNIYLLDNKNIVIDNINFIGFTQPIECYENSKSFSKYIKCIKTYKKYYNVLLCHSPENICDNNILNKLNVDLILCGHMHGGVVPLFLRKIFKNRGLISPGMGLFPKNVYGNIKIRDANIIITSGIRILPYRILNNIFNIEVVNINLTFNKKYV